MVHEKILNTTMTEAIEYLVVVGNFLFFLSIDIKSNITSKYAT